MRFFLVFLLLFTMGCTNAVKTSIDSSDLLLKPTVCKGSAAEIHEVAFVAARKAFPDEDGIIKGSERNVRIERDFFWHGDTVIEIWVKPINDNECVLEAEHKSNWHRGNGAIGNLSDGELKHYLSTFKRECSEFLNGKSATKILQADK